jgi:hypothetical protein
VGEISNEASGSAAEELGTSEAAAIKQLPEEGRPEATRRSCAENIQKLKELPIERELKS